MQYKQETDGDEAEREEEKNALFSKTRKQKKCKKAKLF